MEQCSFSVHIAFQNLYVKCAEYYENTVSYEYCSLISTVIHDFLCRPHIPNCCKLQHPLYPFRNTKAASTFHRFLSYTWWLPPSKSLTKRQFVVTYTIGQTEISTLPESRITNTSTYFTKYRNTQHHSANQLGYRFRFDTNHRKASSLGKTVLKEEASWWLISSLNLKPTWLALLCWWCDVIR